MADGGSSPDGYRRAIGLSVRWIEGEPQRRLVVDPARGVQAAVGPHALALLDLFDAGRSVSEVLGAVLSNDAGKPARAGVLRIISRLAQLGFLEPADAHVDDAARPLEPFHEFEQFDYHVRMLADSPRVSAYARAIERAIAPGMAVLEIGAGTGILSLFAARALARAPSDAPSETSPASGAGGRVYAVEKGCVIEMARRVVREAHLEDRIQLIAGDSRRIELPQPVDLIVCELIGNRVLNEGILESILDARARHLKPGGRVIPRILRLIAYPARIEEFDGYRTSLAGIERETGFPAAPLLAWLDGRIRSGGLVVEIGGGAFHCTPLGIGQEIVRLDLESFEEASAEGETRLRIDAAGRMNGILIVFEAVLWDDIVLDVRPESPETHWQRPFYPLAEPLDVSTGDEIPIRLRYRSGENMEVGLAP
ncbi:MAG: hypothetical protein JXP34_02145 [Planctomycetes bacterium]|nr:hypothetical protein [Planctomycetota bacterium]